MTPVSSAVKMVGQLRRWLTGDEVNADGCRSDENVSEHYSTCSCARPANELHYRGRSYSDCCTASCRSARQELDVRERSCSVSSRRMPSQGWKRLGLRTYRMSGSTWSAGHPRDVGEVLEEDRELCHCWSSGSVEPVCCCERCFVYIDERPSPQPLPYNELMLIEQYSDLRKRLADTKQSADVTAVDVADPVSLSRKTVDNISSSAAGTCSLTSRPVGDVSPECEVTSTGQSLSSSTSSLPVSVHASLDGEEGYAESQRRLRSARRQRLLDNKLATTAYPPPNRTICHVVDCW